MKRFILYLLLGIFFAFLQSSVFPLFLPPNWRPNLILILVLYLGLSEELLCAILSGLVLGAIQDSFCGHSLGLYVSVYLVILLVTRLLSEQLNVESPPLLLLLIAAGTLVQTLLLAAFLTILAETAPVLHILLPAIPQQLLGNLLFAGMFFFLLQKVQRVFGYRSGLAGLFYQSKHHGT